MSPVHIHEETQLERGWSFRVTWADARADPLHDQPAEAPVRAEPPHATAVGRVQIELRLDWHDYEHWSHGVAPPSEVARVVMECVREALEANRPTGAEAPPAAATTGPAEMLRSGRRVDASTLRRLVPGLDEMVRERLG